MIVRPVLTTLPLSAKVLLTLFLLLIGVGYLAALGNLYHQHSLADGKEGLSLDDLRAAFHGLEVAPGESGSDQDPAMKSRMQQMIEPGGEMRKHLIKGGPQAVRTLETWLQHGAVEAQFTQKGLAGAGDPAAADVIMSRCLDCHNADGGEKADVPFGPDLFTPDYQMVMRVAAPGTAKLGQAAAGELSDHRTLGPQTIPHLFLVTHIHMLSIPVFTLIVGGLFLISSLAASPRHLLVPIPMAALTCDFACWWLAREWPVLIYVIASTGAIYGVSMGGQLLTVVASLWFWKPADQDDR